MWKISRDEIVVMVCSHSRIWVGQSVINQSMNQSIALFTVPGAILDW